MSAYITFLNDLINKNHENFHDINQLKWVNPYQAEYYEEIRSKIINGFSSKINWSFKNTKPWINQISKGCELCGLGEWSCIFITGQCNAKCFYCPASQNSDDTPMAQQISFETAEKYADFLNFSGFKGISFSGGEPFLVYDKLINYLETIRKYCNSEIYIWMYTNGILSSSEKFQKLADLGLNEIRFDIGATDYKLGCIKNAKGIIKNITIEIPLDPNKKELIKELLPEMFDLGVNNINLHQLRLTKYNAHNLIKNNYTFLHGEHPTVLESELGVLEILDYADKISSPIGINYCAFQYKNRFQKAGFRRKISSKIFINEYVTENGYKLNIYGSHDYLILNDITTEKSINDLISKELIYKISIDDLLNEYQKYTLLILDFTGTILLSGNSTDRKVQKIEIGNSAYYVENGRPVAPVIIRKGKIKGLINLILNEQPANIPDDKDLFNIWRHLFIEQGFRQYF